MTTAEASATQLSCSWRGDEARHKTDAGEGNRPAGPSAIDGAKGNHPQRVGPVGVRLDHRGEAHVCVRVGAPANTSAGRPAQVSQRRGTRGGAAGGRAGLCRSDRHPWAERPSDVQPCRSASERKRLSARATISPMEWPLLLAWARKVSARVPGTLAANQICKLSS